MSDDDDKPQDHEVKRPNPWGRKSPMGETCPECGRLNGHAEGCERKVESSHDHAD